MCRRLQSHSVVLLSTQSGGSRSPYLFVSLPLCAALLLLILCGPRAGGADSAPWIQFARWVRRRHRRARVQPAEIAAAAGATVPHLASDAEREENLNDDSDHDCTPAAITPAAAAAEICQSVELTPRPPLLPFIGGDVVAPSAPLSRAERQTEADREPVPQVEAAVPEAEANSEPALETESQSEAAADPNPDPPPPPQPEPEPEVEVEAKEEPQPESDPTPLLVHRRQLLPPLASHSQSPAVADPAALDMAPSPAGAQGANSSQSAAAVGVSTAPSDSAQRARPRVPVSLHRLLVRLPSVIDAEGRAVRQK